MLTNKMNPSDELSWIGYSLKITQHHLRLRLEAALEDVGITASQNATLLAIYYNPRISNAALARAAFVTPQSMQGLLVNLERAGLITRTPHPEHGRIIMTELTRAGLKAARAGMAAAENVEKQMLSGLSSKETKILSDLLKRCAAALEN